MIDLNRVGTHRDESAGGDVGWLIECVVRDSENMEILLRRICEAVGIPPAELDENKLVDAIIWSDLRDSYSALWEVDDE